MTERFVVGIVSGSFGISGQMKVRILSGETAHLKKLKDVVLRTGNSEKKYEVLATSGTASSFIMKLKGIDSPEAVKLLRGAELLVERSRAAPLARNEFYIEDLRTLPVHLAKSDGECLGHIRDILDGGGGQLVELELNSGERRLVPFMDEFFGEISVRKGFAVLKERWILE